MENALAPEAPAIEEGPHSKIAKEFSTEQSRSRDQAESLQARLWRGSLTAALVGGGMVVTAAQLGQMSPSAVGMSIGAGALWGYTAALPKRHGLGRGRAKELDLTVPEVLSRLVDGLESERGSETRGI